MTPKKPTSKESNKRNIRIFSYLLFFYFGIRLLILPILAFQEEALELFGLFGIIVNIGIAIFGLYATYYLRKIKKWALIALIIIFILNIISVLVLSTALGNTKLPAVQIGILAFLLLMYRNFKNAKMI